MRLESGQNHDRRDFHYNDARSEKDERFYSLEKLNYRTL
jgi:hypothetical protein